MATKPTETAPSAATRRARDARQDPPSSAVRDRIVAAAVELLHERGIKHFTQTSVSSRAGVRQSHLTYYFPTRNDLLKQAVRSGMDSLLAMIDPPAATGTESVPRFRRVLESQLEDRRIARMMAGMVVASEEDPALKPWLEQFSADMLAHLRQSFAARGVHASRAELELFQTVVVGAAHLDLAASSATSSRRMRAIVRLAFERLIRSAKTAAATRADKART